MTANGAEPIESPELNKLIEELQTYVDQHQEKTQKKGILQFGLKDTIAKSEAAKNTNEALKTIKSILTSDVNGANLGSKLGPYEIQQLNQAIDKINNQIGALSKIKGAPFNLRLGAILKTMNKNNPLDDYNKSTNDKTAKNTYIQLLELGIKDVMTPSKAKSKK